jgi:hypothetical protein
LRKVRKSECCLRPHFAKGLCNTHYLKTWRESERGRAWTSRYKKDNEVELKKASIARNRTVKSRFAYSKGEAKRRGFDFNLDLDSYASLISGKCHYMGCDMPKSGSGLDRMDNSKGYVLGNVVPCCWSCNMIKGNTVSYEEMLAIAKLLKEMRK